MLLQIQRDAPTHVAPQIAEVLEKSLSERIVNIVVCQKDDDPNSVYFDCIKRDAVHDFLSKLEKSSIYTDLHPSRDVIIKEGTSLTIVPKGNLKFEDDEIHKSTEFNSNINTARQHLLSNVPTSFYREI